MTNCSVCQRDTSPVKIGGQLYCNVCGTPLATEKPPAPATVAPNVDGTRRVSLDLTPRTGPPATALHARVKPARILDLRPTVEPPAKVVHHPPHAGPATPPGTATHERHLAHFTDRFEKAKQFDRSPHIKKFGTTGRLRPEDEPAITKNAEPAPQLPHAAATQHEAMTKLVPAAVAAHKSAPAAPSAKHSAGWRPNLRLSPHAGKTAATVAGIALMSGYIWFQNYPKLALQNASSQAGISATMPGYLPSSYTLRTTDTGPGLVTLSFASPSAGEMLKISQHRTSWDSTSLLDNFVAKHTDDYASIQGQGLTIYLYNNNHAAWVNHGIRYGIEGASRLSREQILKIAYSL